MDMQNPKKKLQPYQKKPAVRRMERIQTKEPSYKEFEQQQWKIYQGLQTKVTQALEKLKHDIEQGASNETILEHRNQLLLLLGECNYMAREYMKLQFENKKAS